ncbi:hypothetical protein F0562_034898 [Nyssa sinensis]|uniref:Uncharacterized protein n=1 Tax=Nyssa sinensis TaxID=561372 RepID=A0A5J5AD24_9ASTE|nr:hypothetical protein F0562_034898 [Nyssa sinensis]
MSSGKKEEKGAQDAAERIKAAALTAAKGLSRAQAERAAAAAARNVNAYGQKEEGPSRWQERKEAKRQMYLMSTEKQIFRRRQRVKGVERVKSIQRKTNGSIGSDYSSRETDSSYSSSSDSEEERKRRKKKKKQRKRRHRKHSSTSESSDSDSDSESDSGDRSSRRKNRRHSRRR